MKKKLLASVLALSLALGLAVPAFAGDTEVTGGTATLEITAKMVLPTIKVTVGATSNLVVNPYGMQYTDATVNANDNTDKVISAATAIMSKSTIGLTVKATATVEASNNIKVVESKSSITDTTVDPSIYLFLQLKNLNTADVTNTSDVVTVNSSVSWADDDDGSTAFATIGKTTNPDETATIDLAVASDTAPVYGGFKVGGTSGGTNWVSGTDKVNKVSVILTFTPKIGTGSAS